VTTRLPRLDAYLVGIGEELEDLSRVGGAQPFAPTGPSLPREDLALLAAAAAGGAVKGTSTLTGAGLVADGLLTEDGRTVATLLTAPTSRLRVESGRGRAPLTLDVHVRGGLALAVATASPAALTEAPTGEALLAAAGTVTLDVLDAAAVPAHIASWVGLGPAWALATSPTDVPEDTVLARVDDADIPPPPDADAHLRHAWAQPWHLWTVRSSAGGHGLVVVRAGTAGHLALTSSSVPGHVGLHPVASAALWAGLVDLVSGAVRAG